MFESYLKNGESLGCKSRRCILIFKRAAELHASGRGKAGKIGVSITLPTSIVEIIDDEVHRQRTAIREASPMAHLDQSIGRATIIASWVSAAAKRSAKRPI